MKKILAVVIALLMTVPAAVTAFAADGGSVTNMGTGEKTIDVIASYHPSNSGTGSDDVGKVYNVDITWENMNFVYTDSGAMIWNPDTHTYFTTTEGKWDKTEAKITVINHSNVAVNVAIVYTSMVNTGITGAITNGTATLQAGKVGKPDEADSMTATLTISGKPNSSVTKDGIKIGTITIQIS